MAIVGRKSFYKGRSYFHRNVSLFGQWGKVSIVEALESLDPGHDTVLVRFQNGDKQRVPTHHLHNTEPQSRKEMEKNRAEKWREKQNQIRKEAKKSLEANKLRKQAVKRAINEQMIRKHIEAEKRRKDLEKRQKDRAKRLRDKEKPRRRK